eukprot:COSAG01_NODE_1445_length_10281_cov_33.445099_2_plen_139_part_00
MGSQTRRGNYDKNDGVCHSPSHALDRLCDHVPTRLAASGYFRLFVAPGQLGDDALPSDEAVRPPPAQYPRDLRLLPGGPRGHNGIYVEKEGPKLNIPPQNDPNWNTEIRRRYQIGIWGTNMEYLGVEGPKWNITLYTN